MKAPSPLSLTKAAIAAAHAAGAIQRRHFRKKLKISEKKGAGIVTEVDLASEEKIIRILRKQAPQMSFLAEESGRSQDSNGQLPGRWLVDPLDGTTNFAHGFPMFCVSIAAEWEGRLVAAVIHHPIFEETYVATLGKGARCNGKPIFVSKTAKIQESLLTTGFSYSTQGEALTRDMRAFSEITARARAVRRPGSAALDLAYTARGIFDGFWERNLAAWDVSAGILLVREAGGKVTDYTGKHAQPEDRSIVATNSCLHAEVCSLIRGQ